jgi:hypothetical protein
MAILSPLLSSPSSRVGDVVGPGGLDWLDELDGELVVGLGVVTGPVSTGSGVLVRAMVLKCPDASVVQSTRNGAVPVQVNALRQQANIGLLLGPRAVVRVASFPDPSFISQQMR